jgi:GTP-binding protein LepA
MPSYRILKVMQSKIRNFCIIAHIDHGKSTLADRLLEKTATVAKREMKEQLLDSMDLERERGITIKLQPATMSWKEHQLNLIDTPGHVDFSYEVSRSLAACEGALLVVDATQGIQAQTLANLHLAEEAGLRIIPVINKIDLPAAQPEDVAAETCTLTGLPDSEVIFASGKSGDGVEDILDAVVERIPAPAGDANQPLTGLIFDSVFDTYRGVITYLRIMDGSLKKNAKVKLMGSGKETEALEVGTFSPERNPQPKLATGQVGYVVTGLKQVADARVGDTVTAAATPATTALPGYSPSRPMVFAGMYAASGDDYPKLKDALEKLALNDASLSFEPHKSPSLGLGFRCGFLGLLHLDIIRQRLEREYNLEIVITAPSVSYEVITTTGEQLTIANPGELPDPTRIEELREPWVDLEVVTPSDYVGAVLTLIDERRGKLGDMEYASETRVVVKAELPLATLVVDFYDALKAATSGYASMNYRLKEYRSGDLVKLDFLVAGDMVEGLSTIVHRTEASTAAHKILEQLKELIPRAQFQIPIQGAIGGKIIARENISPVRKNVTAGLYGGDVTRKRKVLEKQKKGKKRLAAHGSVTIPPEAFLAVMKR